MRCGKCLAVLACVALFITGCKKHHQETPTMTAKGTFADDLAFLKQHTDVIVLADGDARIAVVPAYQGRIMTSSAAGDTGLSFGWVNRELIASGKLVEHINVFGGEDRFWLGPEGGQFSIFFKKDVPFDMEHWFTPAPIDSEPFELVSSTPTAAVFKKDMTLENYSGTQFNLRVDREVRLVKQADAVAALGVTPAAGLKMVAFESVNKITNTGEQPWTKQGGLLSIWILGMFNPADATTVVVPFNTGAEADLGPIVNDAYFGKVPPERLVVKPEQGVLYFSGDGKYRSKIGLTPQRAKAVCGSYDADNKALTIVVYTKPQGATDYVNSMWELQDEPFAGDVVNSYNDGPETPGGKPLGPFYELETSSPAAALAPGESLSHTHTTIHLVGPEADLDAVAKAVLGATTAEIKAALPK